MSRGQIQALYFGASASRCNYRLRQLFDHNMLRRHATPAAPFGAQFLYSLGAAAVPVVSPELDLDISTVRKLSRAGATPMFIDHTLQIVNLRLAFLKGAAEWDGFVGLRIECWLPELLCRHEYRIRSHSDGPLRAAVFAPDAFVRLELPTANPSDKPDRQPTELEADGDLLPRDGARLNYQSYFIECCRGTVASRQFAEKIASHSLFLRCGLFTKIFGGPHFKTLVVTTGERRLRHLLALAERLESDLFWFTTFSAIRQSSPLGAVWHVPGSQALAALVPLPAADHFNRRTLGGNSS